MPVSPDPRLYGRGDAELTPAQVQGLQYLQGYAQAGIIPSLSVLDQVNAQTYPGQEGPGVNQYMKRVHEMFWNFGPMAQLRLQQMGQLAAMRSTGVAINAANTLLQSATDPQTAQQLQGHLATYSQLYNQLNQALATTVSQDPLRGEAFRA